MIYRTYIPRPPLSAFVERFWLYEGDAVAHARERVLPTGSMQIVFNLRHDALRVYDRQDTSRFRSFGGGLISGAQSEFVVIDTASQAALMGVAFKPGGAFPFLPLPTGELHNTHASLDTFWGTRAGDLREQLIEAPTPQNKFRALEQALLAQATRPLTRHPAVVFALRELQAVPHTRTLADLAAQLGFSSRRFIQLFHDEVGLTPKLFCRIRRFQQALHLMRTGQPVAWADVALACGYCDQAHLIRDFQAFSGLTPVTCLAQRGPHDNHIPL
jgi:AraC-like DNA-binding protein